MKIWNKMAVDLKQQLDRVATKADLVVERDCRLRDEKNAADARIAELTAELERNKVEIEKLTMENEYLRIASTLAPDGKRLEETRSLIAGLVREIDRCILDLNE